MNTNVMFKSNSGRYSNRYEYTCTCGHKDTHYFGYYGRRDVAPCKGCGTTIFKTVTSKKTATKKAPMTIVEESSSKGFKVKRVDVEYKYNIEEDTTTLVSQKEVGRMVINFKDNEFYIEDLKTNERYNINGLGLNVTEVTKFLKDIEDVAFIQDVTVNSKELHNLLLGAYESSTEGYWGQTKNLTKAIINLVIRKEVNVIANLGFNAQFIKSLMYNNWLTNKNETKAHKILGIEKYMLGYIKDMTSWNDTAVRTLNWFNSKFGSSNVKYLFDNCNSSSEIEAILSRGYIQQLLRALVEDYKYDFKRLIKYALIDVKYQGIESISNSLELLRDCNEMAKQMRIELKEKYPKSLKMVHDILAMNHRAMRNKENEEAFKNFQDEWKRLEYHNNEFSIVIPQSPSDIVKEGSQQNNCVASYVGRVKEGKCTIVFLRRTAHKDISEVTIELRGKNIVQVKAYNNREINKVHKAFIEQWAKAKKLSIAY